jgi:hypothetical protein
MTGQQPRVLGYVPDRVNQMLTRRGAEPSKGVVHRVG